MICGGFLPYFLDFHLSERVITCTAKQILLFFALILFIVFHLLKNGYLHHSELLSLNTIINTVIVLSSMLVVYLGVFLIYEVGCKGICANKEIKQKLMDWVVQKYFWGFVIGVVILGLVTRLL